MMPSRHSTSSLPVTTSNNRLSDLPDCLRTFHARRKRGIIAASKRGSSSQYYDLPPAFHSCLKWRTTADATSTSKVDHDGTVDPSSRTTMTNDDPTTTSVQRMPRIIHRKRGAWQQMALRNRHEANPHHQEMLQSLKEAAQRAKAVIAMDRDGPFDPSDEFIPPQALLNQGQGKNIPTLASTSTSSSADASPDVNNLDISTATVRIQANYRGFKTRRTLHDIMGKGTNEALQDNPTSIISLSCVPYLQHPKFERQISNITMSDLGDSTHHACSPDLSNVNRSRSWIEEGIEEDHQDSDDDLFIPDKLVRCSGEYKPRPSLSRLVNKDHHGRTMWHYSPLDKAVSTSGLQKSVCTPTPSKIDRDHASSMTGVSAKKLSCTPKHHASWRTMVDQIDDSTDCEDMRRMTAMGHASLNSYFGPYLASNFQQDMKQEFSHMKTQNSKRSVQLSTSSQTPSRSQKVEDLIDSMLEGDHDDDDDDVSLAESFFEEQSRVDKHSLKTRNTLHRSDGSLDFSSAIERRAATFRDVIGTMPEACFHLSLSSRSRWDDGLPDPTSISLLPPKHQMTISKAAVSTFLPVRQPPRKLSPIDIDTLTDNIRSGKNNDSPTNTIFSPTESTEPSPTMPLRKASSHGTAHLTFQSKERERSYKSLIPAPPLTTDSHAGRPSRATMSELFSPQVPIRKVSSHNTVYCPQGDRTLNVVPCIPAMAATILEDGPIRQPQRKVSSLPPENQLQ